MHGFERRQAQAQPRNFERQQARGVDRRQAQVQVRGFDQQQARGFERRQAQAQFQPQQVRNQQFGRQAFAQVNNDYASTYYGSGARGLIDGCPPGLAAKNNGCLPPGQAAKLLGSPLSAASAFAPMSVLPQSLSYYYPDTSDYYWRYGDGYLYQVDRGTNLIASLMPLIGGGYMPGQYLPAEYMNSYVPQDYGLSSFYPDYGGVCNRYYDGVIYQADCASGMVQDMVPIYAGGYGVGQMLPASYGYYNVPMQYRSLYYDTPNAGYYYAPGAIYQYDPNSSVITSVAALLSPGFAVGQPLPVGYDVYNVPYGYRATYYDTPNAWYRYNNGYIYQVDPVTQIVTAIVASLLT